MTMKKTMVSALVALMLAPAAYATANVNQDEAVDKQGRAIMDARGNCVMTKWDDNDGRCGNITKEQRTVYFDFNKSTLKPSERAKLDNLVRMLKGMRVESVDIYGFADMIGDGGYNQKLSRKRAEVVKSYLWNKGVKVRKLDLRALGETQPVTKCDDKMPRAQLISCLAEDRRVEIELNFTK